MVGWLEAVGGTLLVLVGIVGFYFSIKTIKGWGNSNFLNTQLVMYKDAFEDGEKRHDIERQRWQDDMTAVKKELAEVKGQMNAYSKAFAEDLTRQVILALKSEGWGKVS